MPVVLRFTLSALGGLAVVYIVSASTVSAIFWSWAWYPGDWPAIARGLAGFSAAMMAVGCGAGAVDGNPSLTPDGPRRPGHGYQPSSGPENPPGNPPKQGSGGARSIGTERAKPAKTAPDRKG
jgi:hypothetical protein